VACPPSIPDFTISRAEVFGVSEKSKNGVVEISGKRAVEILRHSQIVQAVGFAMRAPPGDNLGVEKKSSRGQRSPAKTQGLFLPGAIVIATLCNPREKFWGMILALASEGLSLSGAELASFEDLTVMVRDGEPFTPAVVFFPMHRIERLELDLPDGNLPSLSQRFLSKTGMEPAAALTPSSHPKQAAGLGDLRSQAKERP
jgi:hypothetical protein